MGKLDELQSLSLATTYELDESFDSEKFIKMRLRVCHDGTNPNKSNFDVEVMNNAKDSIKNIPILANVLFDEDGQPQFGGHDMELEQNKTNEGEYKLIYKETPIGLVPETCNHEISEYNGKNYVFVDAYIWKEYSNYAQDIIERDKDIKLSMEIIVDEYSYNAKEKYYKITDYRYQGITFLNKDFGTGMENALATTETFNLDTTKERFIMMMDELKDTLTSYTIHNKNIGEGGNDIVDEKLQLIAKYNLTPEQLDFSIEEISLEDLETKLKEFDAETKESETEENEKFIKSFELSHSEIKSALYKLLAPVESNDSEWYFIDQVYDNRFEYENWDGTKIYRQTYKNENDVVSFEGDRVDLYQERLTKEEKDALEAMRGNYSALEIEVKELRDYQSSKFAEERKVAETELFEQFAELNGNEEFEQLKTKSSDYELDALEKECFAILGRKSAKFSAKPQTNKAKVKIEFSKDKINTGEFDELFEKHIK